ncbi:hypothetical protein N7537_008131 [Penicillium hordei]|jgi:hypothetical protein|uniref:Uncharacterized protein n=1 Tax=Penicillium hordei TaxID=40994 RepID=A0AAD6DZU4_9EURO|nr:uncharacterized protein N7537_008131 [Penicillium hordei]KAJ5598047.1 hypothetical protein N7537_008131 [Penicillium hordei]
MALELGVLPQHLPFECVHIAAAMEMVIGNMDDELLLMCRKNIQKIITMKSFTLENTPGRRKSLRRNASGPDTYLRDRGLLKGFAQQLTRILSGFPT